jgi:hypothetical protein
MTLSMKSHQTVIETVCRSIRSSRFVSSEIFVDGAAKPFQLERVLKRWEQGTTLECAKARFERLLL